MENKKFSLSIWHLSIMTTLFFIAAIVCVLFDWYYAAAILGIAYITMEAFAIGAFTFAE